VSDPRDHSEGRLLCRVCGGAGTGRADVTRAEAARLTADAENTIATVVCERREWEQAARVLADACASSSGPIVSVSTAAEYLAWAEEQAEEAVAKTGVERSD